MCVCVCMCVCEYPTSLQLLVYTPSIGILSIHRAPQVPFNDPSDSFGVSIRRVSIPSDRQVGVNFSVRDSKDPQAQNSPDFPTS